MKTAAIAFLALMSFIDVRAQQTSLPEFDNKPACIDTKTNRLIELEKASYNSMAKANGLFKAEGGYFLEGTSSSAKITKQQKIQFVVKVTPGTDPTSVFDLAKFEVRKDKRIYITTKAKVTSTTTAIQKISYDVKKIKKGYYYLVANGLEKGEYFFGANDFMFAFSVE
jgi:hypothetical protein